MRRLEKETQPQASYVVERFGAGPYMEYRIPGMVVTCRGTLICCYEGRMDTHNDWASIDIVVCRSTDEGKSFTRQVIASGDEAGEADSPETWNNPVLIADDELVHLVFHKNYESAYYCFSSDEGESFSDPVDITEAFLEFPFRWNVCASGPGHGIVTERGRLMIPVWLAAGEVLDSTGRIKAHNPSTAGVIYSDDRGRTWQAGTLVDGIKNANETTIAQISGGRILFNFRNGEELRCRVLGISPDGVSGFTKIWTETGLPDPQCFASMVKADGQALYFINCANNNLDHPMGKRIFLTCFRSEDDGTVWTPVILVDTYGGYADLAVFGDKLYVFYEQSTWNDTLRRVHGLMMKQFKVERRTVL